jgi:hypothetical protein
MDNAGNLVWAVSFGGNADDVGYSIKLDQSGNIITTGLYSTNGTSVADFDPGAGVYNLPDIGNGNAYISKLDNMGQFVWAKSFSANEVAGLALVTDAMENIYSLGFFNGTVDFDPGAAVHYISSGNGGGTYVSKLDKFGNFVWVKTSNTGGNIASGGDIAIDETGKLYMTTTFFNSCNFDGNFLTNKGDMDFAIAKIHTIDPCVNVSCNISPGVYATNVLNTGCNNGTIKVKRGTGVYHFYPHIELYKDTNLITFIDLSPGTAEYTFTNLIPGKYTVKVSDGVCCQITFIRNIKCRAPSSGFQASNITATSAQLTWNVANCAEGYRVLYRKKGTTTWQNKGVSTNTGMLNLTGLQPQTIYEWRVGTKCNGWPEIMDILAYSPISTFNTSALRVGEVLTPPNAAVETFEINVFPNPATYTLAVNFECQSETARLKVVNVLSEALMQKRVNAVDGIFETQLDIAGLKCGIYMLKVETENGECRKVFVKE